MRHWKKRVMIGVLVLLMGRITGRAQGFDAEQLILDWQKLTQLKQILDDMVKGYQIVEKGYTTIRDISHGNFDLHKVFLDGLLAVSPAVKDYFKVAEIIQCQQRIVEEYKRAYARFKSDGHFSSEEIGYMGGVYGALFDGSLKTLVTLISVLTDGQLRASDDDRLRQIDRLHQTMLEKLGFLRQFNNEGALLSLQRARDQEDAEEVKKLYGLTN